MTFHSNEFFLLIPGDDQLQYINRPKNTFLRPFFQICTIRKRLVRCMSIELFESRIVERISWQCLKNLLSEPSANLQNGLLRLNLRLKQSATFTFHPLTLAINAVSSSRFRRSCFKYSRSLSACNNAAIANLPDLISISSR